MKSMIKASALALTALTPVAVYAQEAPAGEADGIADTVHRPHASLSV